MKALSYISATIAVACTISSCNNKTEEMQEKIDSLNNVLQMQESQINNANSFIDLMNTSMDSVIVADGSFIVGADKEGVLNSREKMQENLDTYSKMLQSQRARIEELEKQIKDNQDAASKKMAAMIAKMKAQIDAKDKQIAQLQEELANNKLSIAQLQQRVQGLSRDVAYLTLENRRQQDDLDEANAKLTTGYYIVASKKELKNLGIMSGGSLLKKSKLSMGDADASKFTQIDITKTKTIQIPDKSPKILTQAPSDSYTLQKDGKGSVLTITNPEKFWSISNFLVIQY